MRRALFAGAAALVAACAEDGMPGRDGVDGMDGARPIGSLSCLATVDGYVHSYQAVEYNTGDLLVWCAIAGGNLQSSTAIYYLPEQIGATTGGCDVRFDLEQNASGGFWRYQYAGETAAVEYIDPGSSVDGYTVTFLASECNYFEP
jgi:hypothetical protein